MIHKCRFRFKPSKNAFLQSNYKFKPSKNAFLQSNYKLVTQLIKYYNANLTNQNLKFMGMSQINSLNLNFSVFNKNPLTKVRTWEMSEHYTKVRNQET